MSDVRWMLHVGCDAFPAVTKVVMMIRPKAMVSDRTSPSRVPACRSMWLAILAMILLPIAPLATNAMANEIAPTNAHRSRKEHFFRLRHHALESIASPFRSSAFGVGRRLLSRTTGSLRQTGNGVNDDGDGHIQPHGMDVRGGGGDDLTRNASIEAHSSLSEVQKNQHRRRRRLVLWSLTTSTLIYMAYRERALWRPFMNKDFIQSQTLSLLGALQPADDAGPYATVRALVVYALGMAAWEMAGLSTIPVETAAGMVFTFPQAAVASLCGKLLGATLAFTAGRTILARHIANHKAFTDNAVFQLLSNLDEKGVDGHSITARHPPLWTAFFMKFSCFPELVKNLGSSVIPVIRLWMFVLATTVHGGFFTLVWTWLGVDSAARLKQHAAASTALTLTIPVNRPLQVALVAAMIVGGVLTPLAMAWWIRDLKIGAAETESSRHDRRVRLNAIMSSTTTTTTEQSSRRKGRPLSAAFGGGIFDNEIGPWNRLKERLTKSQIWIVGLIGATLFGSGGGSL
jgi:hypothetical protein